MPTDRDSAITVGLLWHSANSGNLGVGALTLANLAILREAAVRAGVEVRFVLLGWLDRDLPVYVEAADVEVVGLAGRSFRPFGDLQRRIRDCDLIFDIGAGDSFADIYGRRRFAFLALSKLYAVLERRPLVLCPQTIGPFASPTNRRIAAGLMRASAAVFSRDSLSTAYARQLGVDRVQESTDVAFRLPAEPPHLPPADGKVRFGLNVSALLYNGGYDGKNMFGLSVDYPGLVDRLLERLTARPDVEVHLVPHVLTASAPVEDDLAVSADLAQRFPGAVLAPRFAGPCEAKGYIGAMDVFAGARMHACIAALSSGVPLAPLAYSRKFEGLFGSLGYAASIDCRTETTEGALAKVVEALERRTELKQQAEAACATALERLGVYEDAVETMLAQRRRSADGGTMHARAAA